MPSTTSTASKDSVNIPSGDDSCMAAGGRKILTTYNQAIQLLPQPPSSDGLSQPAGSLLKGATDDDGKLKNAGLMVGIKLDLEAEVHLTVRVRGDIVIGLY